MAFDLVDTDLEFWSIFQNFGYLFDPLGFDVVKYLSICPYSKITAYAPNLIAFLKKFVLYKENLLCAKRHFGQCNSACLITVLLIWQ